MPIEENSLSLFIITWLWHGLIWFLEPFQSYPIKLWYYISLGFLHSPIESLSTFFSYFSCQSSICLSHVHESLVCGFFQYQSQNPSQHSIYMYDLKGLLPASMSHGPHTSNYDKNILKNLIQGTLLSPRMDTLMP